MKPLLATFALLIATNTPTLAQAPGVEIFDQSRSGLARESKSISAQASKIATDGGFLSLEETNRLLKKPTHFQVDLPPAKTTPLHPTAIAKAARESSYRVGWAYLCPTCDNWHTKLAGGYAITSDGVIATCAHVLDKKKTKMREGSLIAVDHTGKVFPITTLLANDAQMDGALIKINAKTIPLSFNDNVSPGDDAFCFSRPMSQGQYYSEGIVNRFFWQTGPRGKNESSLQAMRYLKMNVSSRWAPGSSGSAVLDQYGNAIGHVALILNMGQARPGAKKGDPRQTMITLHTAIPARAMTILAYSAADNPKATIEAKAVTNPEAEEAAPSE